MKSHEAHTTSHQQTPHSHGCHGHSHGNSDQHSNHNGHNSHSCGMGSPWFLILIGIGLVLLYFFNR